MHTLLFLQSGAEAQMGHDIPLESIYWSLLDEWSVNQSILNWDVPQQTIEEWGCYAELVQMMDRLSEWNCPRP